MLPKKILRRNHNYENNLYQNWTNEWFELHERSCHLCFRFYMNKFQKDSCWSIFGEMICIIEALTISKWCKPMPKSRFWSKGIDNKNTFTFRQFRHFLAVATNEYHFRICANCIEFQWSLWSKLVMTFSKLKKMHFQQKHSWFWVSIFWNFFEDLIAFKWFLSPLNVEWTNNVCYMCRISYLRMPWNWNACILESMIICVSFNSAQPFSITSIAEKSFKCAWNRIQMCLFDVCTTL